MRKLHLLLMSLVVLTTSAFGQLSTRENDATTLKLGTRAEAGDMALTFAFDLATGTTASLPISNRLLAGDVLTFKYFSSPNTAIRAGIRLYKESESLNGDLGGIVTGTTADKVSEKMSSREYILVPGIERHFSAGNIFDVYAGADLYIGTSKVLAKSSFEDGDGTNFLRTKITTSALTLGVGGVVGFNVFIAQLPVSLGVEYGLNAKWNNSGKSKIVTEQLSGGTTTEETYYTYDNSTFGPYSDDFSKLSTSEFGMDTNQNVRIVLNIFFSQF